MFLIKHKSFVTLKNLNMLPFIKIKKQLNGRAELLSWSHLLLKSV